MSSVSPITQLSNKQLLVFFGMVVGMFMAVLDIQIVASSLSVIAAGLAASTDELSWVQTSYLIAEVIIIPISGFVARCLSTRIAYFISTLGFTIMSVLCAFAWNIESMIIFRALQGFFGGVMIPTVFSIIFIIFPPAKRPTVTIIIGKALAYLTLFLNSLLDACNGTSFVDSTSIAVCENYRIYSHKVFSEFANRGKTTKGWFYGLKLHLVINPEGGLVKASFSSGNKDDRAHLRTMTQGIFGKVFGDRGYISKELFDELMGEDIGAYHKIEKRNEKYFYAYHG